MERVYKISGYTKLIAILGILLAIIIVGVFIDTCLSPDKADNGFPSLIIIGAITLFFIFAAIICILEFKDNVVLTNEGIRLHLHRQTFPYSFKSINDEFAWKDIKKVYFVEKKNTTFLVLELFSGEVKEFGIGHLEKRLQLEFDERSYPDAGISKDKLFEEEAAEEYGNPERPGILELSKNKKFRQVLLSAGVEVVGAVLIAIGQRWGIVLVFSALIVGGFSLYHYYLYNSLHLNPALAKKGRKAILLGALLLLAILFAALFISDATIPPAS